MQEPHDKLDPISLPPPSHEPAPIRRDGISLVIALIVSAVLLLAAAGVATWAYLQKNQGPDSTAKPKDTSDTKDVKQVTWVAPAEIPAAYAKRDNNTLDTTASYYYDEAAACGLATMVKAADSSDSGDVQNVVVQASNASYAAGVTSVPTVGADYNLKDIVGKEFPFKSVDLAQDVDIANVAFKKQNTLLLYKQFGAQIASISASCKSDSWEAKKPELEALIKTFTVKLER